MMSELIFTLRVRVNDAALEKQNNKRKRLSTQTRTAQDEVMNQIGDLQHNAIFDSYELTEVKDERAVPYVLQALKNSGIDIDCGACMEVAFTGVTTNAHTCSNHAVKAEIHYIGCPAYNGAFGTCVCAKLSRE